MKEMLVVCTSRVRVKSTLPLVKIQLRQNEKDAFRTRYLILCLKSVHDVYFNF